MIALSPIACLLGQIRFVFLDRDGVLNRKLPEGEFVTRPEQLELLPGAAGAVAELNRRQIKVIVVTNQRGIGLGKLTAFELEELHKELRQRLARECARIDAIYFCPHDPCFEECTCRKPKTGMFEEAFADFPEASTETSVMIGDSLSDVLAGKRIGMSTIYISGDAETAKPGGADAAKIADMKAYSLRDAVDMLPVLPDGD